jgi:hypothetical protein
MTKTVLNDLVNLENQTSSVTIVNTNNAVIETAFDNTLSRDGTSPNQMEASLDMNSNRILNLPSPISQLEPIRLVDLNGLELGNVSFSSLPTGGTEGQTLSKNSSTNYDASWVTPPFGLTPQYFGAVGNGIVDDTVALNAFFDAIPNHTGIGSKNGYIPAGTYLFTDTLRISRNDWSIQGAGKYATTLRYVGSANNIDLIQIGDGVGPSSRISLSNLRVDSTTQMISNAGIHFRNAYYVTVENVAMQGNTTSLGNNLYRALWFDVFEWTNLLNVNAYAQSSTIIMNDGGPIYIDGLEILGPNTGIGLHFAGNAGGLSLGEAEIDGLSIGMLVNNDISAGGNTQFFVSNLAKFDSNVNAGIYLNDAVANQKYFSFLGWISASSVNGFVIIDFKDGNINIGGGAQIIISGGSGIVYEDTSVTLVIDPAASVSSNASFGILATSSTNKIFSDFKAVAPNTSGDYNGNCNVEGVGYKKFANGQIHQWGFVVGNASADAAVTFPIPFPTSVNSLTGSVNVTSTSATNILNSVAFGSVSLTGFTGYARVSVAAADPSRSSEGYYWEAWGK